MDTTVGEVSKMGPNAAPQAPHPDDTSDTARGEVELRPVPRLSVVVPVYRDGGRLPSALEQLSTALTATGLTWEIVVVVDGDADAFARGLACRSDRVHVLGYADNRGKGFALRYGISQAVGEVVTFIDCDMQISPDEIGRMARLLELYDADIVVGSKRHPLSVVHYPRFRRFQSLCYQLLVRLLFRVRVRDTQTGLKMMRRDVALQVLDVALVKRFAFDLELLAIATRFGHRRIIEAPVVIEQPFSSTTDLRAAARVLWDTMAVFYRMYIRRWYDRRHGQGVIAMLASLPALLPLD